MSKTPHAEEAKRRVDNAGMRRPASGFFHFKRGHGSKVSKASSGSNMSWLVYGNAVKIIFQILLRETKIKFQLSIVETLLKTGLNQGNTEFS